MADWRCRLAKRLSVRDGQPCALADARAWILELPAEVQEYNAWHASAREMLEATDGGDIDAAVRQLELALFTEGKLKL